jgi:hypothetical protein
LQKESRERNKLKHDAQNPDVFNKQQKSIKKKSGKKKTQSN